jgi:hypothetical protein
MLSQQRIVLIICLLVSAALATPVAEAKMPGEWFLYWIGSDGSKYYVSLDDAGYIVQGNNAVVVSYQEQPQTGYTWLIGEVFNCPSSQYTLSSLDEFDRNRKIVKRYKNDKPRETYKPVSISERQGALINGICFGLPKRPASPDAARSYFKDFEKDVSKILEAH